VQGTGACHQHPRSETTEHAAGSLTLRPSEICVLDHVDALAHEIPSAGGVRVEKGS
jgi:hypothetical protein